MYLFNLKSMLSAAAVSIVLSTFATAQTPFGEGVYHPLDQRTPPGRAGRWSGIVGNITPGYFQPVKVELPEPGTVTFFHGLARRPVDLTEPNQVRLAVGALYRLKIGGMQSFPGIELYPSIELFDHLHPPAGLIDEYPVPIEFTEEEIRMAIGGQLVTKVVFIEEPRLAATVDTPSPLPVRTIANRANLIAEADRVGRPMAIVRLGGRVPSLHGGDSTFFGSGAPVQVAANRPNVDQRRD